MKILIVPSNNLPVPSVLGGAVQTLINDFLNWNETTKKFDITVASIYNQEAEIKAQEYKFTKFIFFNNKRNKTPRSFIEKSLRTIAHYEIGDLFINDVCHALKNNRYDIILVENVKNYGVILRRHFSCPILLHLHNEYFISNKPNIKQMIDSYDKIITVSSYIKNSVNICSSTADVSVLINGIDLNTFDSSKKDKVSLRKKYRINENDVIFVYAARICNDKGTLEAVKAFNLVSNKHKSSAKLIIIGSKDYGETIHDEYFEEVLTEAKRNEDKIIFTGYVKHEEICDFYALSDIGLLTSNFDDPCPLTILEYLAMGLPVIATKSGGIPELVDPKCAILVNRGDEEIAKLKEAMELLIENSDLRTSMGVHGRSIVKSKLQYCGQLAQLMENYVNE